MRCAFCDELVDPDAGRGVELVVWVRHLGRSRRQIASTPTGREACRRCAEDLRAGVTPTSPRLF